MALTDAGKAKSARHARTTGTPQQRLPQVELPCNPAYRNIDAEVYLSHGMLFVDAGFRQSVAGSLGTSEVSRIYFPQHGSGAA